MIRNTVCQQEIIREVYLKFETTFKDLYDARIDKGIDACFCVQVTSFFDESIDFYSICVLDSIWLKPEDLKKKNKKLDNKYIPIGGLGSFRSNENDSIIPLWMGLINRGYTTEELSNFQNFQQRVKEYSDIILTFETVLCFDVNDNLVKQESPS